MRVEVGALSSFTFSARDADNNKITELRRNGNRLVAATDFNALVAPSEFAQSVPATIDATVNATADNFTVVFTTSRAGEFNISLVLASTGSVCRGRRGVKKIVACEAVCPVGMAGAADGGCVCDAGYGLTEKGCVGCESGKRKDFAGNSPCEQCPNGFNCTGEGRSAPLTELPMVPGFWRLTKQSKTAYPCAKGEEVCPNVTMRDGVSGAGCREGHTGAQCDSCEWPAWSENQNGICERCDAEETRDRSFVVLGVGLVLLLSVGSAMAAIVHRKASRGIRASRKQRRLAAEKGASDLDSGPVPEVSFTAYEEDSRVRKTMGKAADALQAAEVSEPSASMSRTKRVKLIWNAGYTLFEVKLRVKIKLLYSFLQMLSLFGLCFQVSWPTEYEVVVRQVNQAVNLMPIGPIAVSCGIGFRWTWHHTLLLKTLAPTAAITLLWMLGRIFGRCGHKAAETTAAALSSTIVFLLYPSLTQTLFSTFNSVEFNAGNGTTASFLAADLSIEYSYGGGGFFAEAEPHFWYQIYSLVMIVLWPVGIPIWLGWMFWSNRRAIAALVNVALREDLLVQQAKLDEAEAKAYEETALISTAFPKLASSMSSSAQLARARTLTRRRKQRSANLRKWRDETKEETATLMREKLSLSARLKQYEPRVFYFDIIECLRKLCLAGLTATISPGTFRQLAIGIFIAAAFFGVTLRLSPYKSLSDDVLAVACQACLVLTLGLAVMLKGARQRHELLLEQLGQADDAGRDALKAEYDDNEAQFGQWLLVVGYAPLVLGAVLALRDVAALHLWRYTSYWRRRHPSNASEVDEQGLAETSEVRLVLPTSAEMVQVRPPSEDEAPAIEVEARVSKKNTPRTPRESSGGLTYA